MFEYILVSDDRQELLEDDASKQSQQVEIPSLHFIR